MGGFWLYLRHLSVEKWWEEIRKNICLDDSSYIFRTTCSGKFCLHIALAQRHPCYWTLKPRLHLLLDVNDVCYVYGYIYGLFCSIFCELLVVLLDCVQQVWEAWYIHTKHSVERLIHVRQNVTEQRDGEDSKHTYGELKEIGASLHKEDTKKRDETQKFQKQPPAERKKYQFISTVYSIHATVWWDQTSHLYIYNIFIYI